MSPESGSDDALPSKLTVSGVGPLTGLRACYRIGRLVRRDESDPSDRAAVEIDIEQFTARRDLDVHRVRRGRHEVLQQPWCRKPVRVLLHHPDAIAGIIGEEERAVVGARIGSSAVELEREPGDRRASRRTCLGRDDLVAVVVREVRARLGGGVVVEVLTDVQVGAVVSRLTRVPFVAGPPEVVDGAVSGSRNPVDLLPVAPADVADPDLVRTGPQGEAERVPQTVRR